MEPWDIAKALKKALKSFVNIHETKKGRPAKGTTWLADQLGVSRNFILYHLTLLEVSPELKEKIKKGKVPYSFIQPIQNVDEEYREKFEQKIIKGEIETTDSAREVAAAIKQYPEKAKELLKQEYRGSRADARDQIRKVIPSYTPTPISEEYEEAISAPTQLGNLALEYYRWLEENPPETIAKFQRKRVVETIVGIKRASEKWLKG